MTVNWNRLKGNNCTELITRSFGVKARVCGMIAVLCFLIGIKRSKSCKSCNWNFIFNLFQSLSVFSIRTRHCRFLVRNTTEKEEDAYDWLYALDPLLVGSLRYLTVYFWIAFTINFKNSQRGLFVCAQFYLRSFGEKSCVFTNFCVGLGLDGLVLPPPLVDTEKGLFMPPPPPPH